MIALAQQEIRVCWLVWRMQLSPLRGRRSTVLVVMSVSQRDRHPDVWMRIDSRDVLAFGVALAKSADATGPANLSLATLHASPVTDALHFLFTIFRICETLSRLHLVVSSPA